MPALIEATGMPRRTAQDTIASLAELDIECVFTKDDGERHNIGRYQIRDWGAIDPRWWLPMPNGLNRRLAMLFS